MKRYWLNYHLRGSNMHKSVPALLVALLASSSVPADCQTTDPVARTVSRSASSETAESAARDLFINGDYDKAVPLLERAVAQDPKDLQLLNVLGMAYLYSSSRIDSRANFAHVQPTMEKVIDGWQDDESQVGVEGGHWRVGDQQIRHDVHPVPRR
jgi:hypothetical protein